MEATVKQKFAITFELETSIRLIVFGLRELQALDRMNDFYFLPFQLLSIGFERYLKATICLQFYNENNVFPKRGIFPPGKKGHDLFVLLEQILEKGFTENYLETRPIAKQDYIFLKEDKHLRKLIRILSDFGQDSRYYNLNVVLDEKVNPLSPEEEWEKIELEFLKENKNWHMDLMDSGKTEQVLKDIINRFIIIFEKFTRAVARLYTLGDLGEEAGRNFSVVKHFIFLKDNDLGKIKYSDFNIYN